MSEVDEIREALKLKLSPDALVLWIRLRLGARELDVADLLAMDGAVMAASELLGAELARVTGEAFVSVPIGKDDERAPLSALPPKERRIAALRGPKQPGAAPIVRECETWALRRYNEARQRAGVKPVRDKEALRKYWRKLALWALEEGVQLAEFLDWSKGRAKWQKGPFPSPASAAGEWLRGEWASRDPQAEAAGSHAGKHYHTGDGVREKLRAEGFDFDEATARYVRAEAELEAKRPYLRSQSDDEEVERAIVWLAKNGGI